MPRARLLSVLAIAVMATLFFVLPFFARFYTDWLWFAEVELQPVFLRTLSAMGVLGAAVFVAALVVLLPNFRLAQGALKERSFTVFGAQGPQTITLDLRRMRPLFDLGAVGASALIALYASAKWELWLMARHAVPFGTTDPILGRDIALLCFSTAVPAVSARHCLHDSGAVRARRGHRHFASQTLALNPQRGLLISDKARRHLSLLAAVMLAAAGLQGMARYPGTADFTLGHRVRRLLH